MSGGRHARPRARGGAAASLLALVAAGAAVVLATSPSLSGTTRWALAGLATLAAVQLLMIARDQRRTSRQLARTEDRLRVLEVRAREESDALHKRVLASIAREGELRLAVELLAGEIGQLRAMLDAFGVAAAVRLPSAPAPSIDLPLLQRAFVETLPPPAYVPAHAAPASAPAHAAPAPPAAPAPSTPPGDAGWGQGPGSAPLAPSPTSPASPAPALVPTAASATPVEDGSGWPSDGSASTWVVREIVVDGVVEPAAPSPVVDLASVETGREAGAWTLARPA